MSAAVTNEEDGGNREWKAAVLARGVPGASGAQLVEAVSGAVQDLMDWDPREDHGGPASLVDRALDSLATASRAQQITAGGISGWLSGYLFNKFGKPVIYMAGSSLIIVLFAEQLGYLTVDWSKFRHDYQTGRRRVEQQVRDLVAAPEPAPLRRHGRPWLDKMKVLARTSPYLTGGFVGGILLGLAS